MYKIGICDDDKILCTVLEEQIYELAKEMDNRQTHIVYISSKESYAMQLFKIQPLDF